MRSFGLALLLCGCAVTSLAQPVMSRGQQALPVNSAECLNRARQALTNVGFSAGGAGNFAQGFKDVSGAYIICNDAPAGGTVVNIVVATIADDSGVPGNLRQLLQAQMANPDARSSPGTPPPPSAAACPLDGEWNWSWTGGQGTVTIYSDGRATGGGKQASWRLVDARSRTYNINWGDTQDTVTLAADCQSLSGSNQAGVRISGTRRGSVDNRKDSCLVGDWNWSWTGGSGSVTVYDDGRATGGGQQATWRLIDGRSRTYQLTWPGLGTADTVTLAPDCRSLSGSNQAGVRINATRR